MPNNRGTKAKRSTYLTRAQGALHRQQIHISKACRVACKIPFNLQQSNAALQEAINDQRLQQSLLAIPDIAEQVLHLTTYDVVFSELHPCRQQAQQAIKDILKEHQSNLQAKHRKQRQRLWYSKRKHAYSQVFQEHDARGSSMGRSPSPINAVQHPLYGPSAQPAIAMQGLYFHRAHLSRPAVPRDMKTFPWEDPGPDSFHLQARKSQQPMMASFTREVYDTALSQLKNGRSPGPDQFPNELLKHLPACMHDLLLPSSSSAGNAPKPHNHGSSAELYCSSRKVTALILQTTDR